MATSRPATTVTADRRVVAAPEPMILTPAEIRAILPGVDSVVNQAARDVAFFSETLGLDNPERDRVLAELRETLNLAKSAQRKLEKELNR